MAEPRVTSGLRYSPLAGLVAVVIYAVTAGSFKDALDVFAVGAIVFAAALAVGALVGFLFGIPRRLQRETADPTAAGSLVVNTNLEQISDWLTKIIVGVGLVEIGKIAGGLDSVAESVALGGRGSADSFALGLIVFSLVDGFLLAYVWTRVELSSQLALADALLQPPPPPPPPLPPPPGAATGKGPDDAPDSTDTLD
jgi:hypothetical protein